MTDKRVHVDSYLEGVKVGRREGVADGLLRAAEIVDHIPMLTGEQAHKIAERIRNEVQR